MPKELYFHEGNQTQKIQLWKEKLVTSSTKINKLDTAKSALLVVDMQRYFTDEDSHAFVETSKTILPNIQHLAQHFREMDRPVIFTYFAVKEGEVDPIDKWWGGTVRDGSKECEIAQEIAPKEDEEIIRKKTYNSFYGTKLKEILRAEEVQDLVITGVLTNLCCETTAREAFCRGFNVFMMLDATASFTEEMHLAALKNLSYSCATSLATNDILKARTAI